VMKMLGCSIVLRGALEKAQIGFITCRGFVDALSGDVIPLLMLHLQARTEFYLARWIVRR